MIKMQTRTSISESNLQIDKISNVLQALCFLKDTKRYKFI